MADDVEDITAATSRERMTEGTSTRQGDVEEVENRTRQLSTAHCDTEFRHLDEHEGFKQETGSCNISAACLKEHQKTPVGCQEVPCGSLSSSLDGGTPTQNEDGLSCDICGMAFSLPSLLWNHRVTHSRDIMTSNVCDKAFQNNHDPQQHEQMHLQNPETPFSRDFCDEAFSRPSLLNQRAGHLEVTIPCKVCKKFFKTSNNLMQHMQIHDKEKSLSCDLCSEAFSLPSLLLSHILTHQDTSRCAISSNPFQSAEDLQCHNHLLHTSDNLLDHEINSGSFNSGSESLDHQMVNLSMASLVNDQQTYPSGQEDLPGTSFSSTSMSDSLPNTSTAEVQVKCDICSETFSHPSELWNHRVIHLDVDTFKCTECRKGFRTAGDLQQHKQIHTSGNPFSCDFCGEAFSTRSSLSKHQRKNHPGDGGDTLDTSQTPKRVHVCSYCCKMFKCKSHLVEHERIHTNEKPFDCKKCGKAFSRQGSLKRHMITHTDNRKPFLCRKCGTTFKTYYYLSKHRKLHRYSPHLTCDICKESFTTKRHLLKHQRKRSREAYICDICNKRCRTCLKLKEHRVYHTTYQRYHTRNNGRKSLKTPSHNKKLQLNERHKKQHKCRFCQKNFDSIIGLNCHLHIHVHAKAKAFSGPSQAQKSTEAAKDKYSCGICSCTFEIYYRMRKHKQMHQDRPFMCDNCEETFITDTDLHQHKQRECDYSRTFVCEVCNKRFHTETVLQRHKIKHILETPYMCGVCHKSFQTTAHLKNHLSLHMGKKPHVCRFCDKAFSKMCSLQKHQQICSNSGSLNPTRQALCFATGSETSNLSPDQPIPQISARRVSKRHQNRRVKSDARLFTCERCPRIFRGQRTFKLHVKTHKKTQPKASHGLLMNDPQEKCNVPATIIEEYLPFHQQKDNRDGLTNTSTEDATSPSLTVDGQPSKQVLFRSISEQEAPAGHSELTFLFSQYNSEHGNMTISIQTYRCQICNSEFDSHGNLEMHTRTHKTKDLPMTTSRVFKEALNTIYSGSSEQPTNAYMYTGDDVTKSTDSEGLLGSAFDDISRTACDGIDPTDSDDDDDFELLELTATVVDKGKRVDFPGSAGALNSLENSQRETDAAALDLEHQSKSTHDSNKRDAIQDKGSELSNVGGDDEFTAPDKQVDLPEGEPEQSPSEAPDDYLSADSQFPVGNQLLANGKKLQLLIGKMQIFSCDVCYRVFEEKQKLDEHLCNHSEETTYICGTCGNMFKNLWQLTDHETKCHRKSSDGRKQKATNDLQTDKTCSCDICTKIFPTQNRLKAHIKSHSEDRTHKCNDCGKCYKYKHHLNDHKIKCGSKAVPQIKRKEGKHQESEPARTDNHVGRPYKCQICQKVCSFKSGFLNHMIGHSRDRLHTCDICGRSYKHKHHLKQHRCTVKTTGGEMQADKGVCTGTSVQGHTRRVRTFKCGVCQDIFPSEYQRLEHQRVHCDREPFRCDKCGKGIPDKNSLWVHLCQVHDEDPKDSWDRVESTKIDLGSMNESECEASGNLASHQSHDEPIPSNSFVGDSKLAKMSKGDFKCQICPKVFALKNGFLHHIMCHTQERLHKCGSCGRAYKHKHHFNSHPCTAKESGKTQVDKGICAKTADVQVHRTRRVRTYQCRVCQETFLSDYQRLEHERVHRDKEPFTCDKCKSDFLDKASLWVHLCQIHDEDPEGSWDRLGSLDESEPEADENQETPQCHDDQAAPIESPVGDTCKRPTETSSRVFECQICSKHFPRKSIFLSHIKCHSQERLHRCNKCGRAYKNIYYLRHHCCMVKANGEKQAEQGICAETSDGRQRVSQSVSQQDRFPDLSLDVRQTPHSHNEHEALSGQETLPQIEPKGGENQESQQSGDEPAHSDSFVGDKLTETSNRDFKCQICSQLFTVKSGFLNHIQSHSLESLHKCDSCGRAYKHKNHLTNHHCMVNKTGATQGDDGISAEMSDGACEKGRVRTYWCRVCQEFFLSKSQHMEHEQLHRDKEPFICDKCSEGFLDKNSLWVHLCQSHDEDPQDSWDRFGSLIIHLGSVNDLDPEAGENQESQQHHHETVTSKSPVGDERLTPNFSVVFKCQICSKHFTLKSVFLNHIKRHSRERLYKCNGCGKTFKHVSNLRNHLGILLTNGETQGVCPNSLDGQLHKGNVHPYRCQECDKAFESISKCLEHEQVQHNKELFRCDKCKNFWSDKTSLWVHLCQIHEEEPEGSWNRLGSVKIDFGSKNNLELFWRQQLVTPDTSHADDVSQMRHSDNHDEAISGSAILTAVEPEAGENQKSHQSSDPSIRSDDPVAEKQVMTPDTSFKCQICPKHYLRKSGFLNHITTHSHERLHKCDICGRSYKYKNHLISHRCTVKATGDETQTHIGGVRVHTYRCRVCRETFASNSQRLEHERGHLDQKPFGCDKCSSGFMDKNSLWVHLCQIHDEASEESWGRLGSLNRDNGSRSNSQLSEHLQTRQSLRQLEVPDIAAGGNSRARDANSIPSLADRHETQHDNLSTNPAIVHARTDQMISSKVVTPHTLSSSSPTKQISHMQREALMNRFQCNVCHKRFRYRFLLRNHSKVHLPEQTRDFICETCGKAFKCARTLKSHQLSHVTVKAFKCKTCAKDFKKKSYLTAHEQIHDVYTKRFMCDKCGRCFRTHTCLRYHSEKHTSGSTAGADGNSSLVPCESCGKLYKSRRLMLLHLKRTGCTKEITHRFICDVCGRSFRKEGFLLKHSRSHRDKRRACKYCHKVFKKQSYLTEHMKAHTDTRPYVCKYCPKAFFHQSTLLGHMNIHTGAKPFKCKTCGAAFTCSGTLYNHQRVHKEAKSRAKGRKHKTKQDKSASA